MEQPDEPVTEKNYFNPVLRWNCADPTVIDDRARTGYFYAYSTRSYLADGSKVYLPIHRSKDMFTWERFIEDGWRGNPPTWVDDCAWWAPDINYLNGKYVLYYALGCGTDNKKSSVGVGISDSPTGPFTDLGMVVCYQNTGVSNSIDPMLFIDGDKKYLYWGSYGSESGVWVVELDDSGLKMREGAKPKKLGYENMEGSYVIKRNGYYYFFGSKGSCCSGGESTYHIIVARADNPLGPFKGKDGLELTSKNFSYTIMTSSPDNVFRGTGHNAQILKDDAGNDWMYYHSFWSGNKYNGRAMCMDQIVWGDDGWPYFKCGTTPSTKWPAPIINEK